MSKIKSKDTKPELKVRSVLHRMGFRFRLHRKDMPGRPDIVLAKHKIVVFVNGCFWHRHVNCREASRPKTNTDYWEKKLSRNVERDLENHATLRKQNWTVIVFWECELERGVDANITKIRDRLGKLGQGGE